MKTPAPKPAVSPAKAGKALLLGTIALIVVLLLIFIRPFARIDTGQVGVVRTFNGKINDEPANVG